MKKMNILLVAVLSLVVLGCASASKKESMINVPTDTGYKFEPVLEKNIGVSAVSGGKKTNPAWTSEIDDAAFKGALADSLKLRGLLAETGGKYQLEVKMLSVKQPLMGLDMTVGTKIQYILKDSASGKVVFDKTIDAEHTATMGDAFAGVKRLRLANEGSAKANIGKFIEELKKLKASDISVK